MLVTTAQANKLISDVWFTRADFARDEPGIVGVAKVSKEAFDDPTQFDAKSDYYDAKSTKDNPRWSCIEVSFHQAFKRLVSLPDLRECAALKEMLILRPGNRLSVTPVTAAEFKAIAGLGGLRK